MGGGNDLPQENQPSDGSVIAEASQTTQSASSPSTSDAVTVSVALELDCQPRGNGKQEPDKVLSLESSRVESTESVDSQRTLDGTESQPPEASGSNGLPKEYETAYEKNAEFMEDIRKETAKRSPLVCCSESIDKLYEEYQHGSEVYQQKIMKLKERHGKIRRCRGDGNCFYRAFGFAWFEQLMNSKNQTLCQNALDALASTKPLLESAGYQSLVYEDFYDTFENQLKTIKEGERDGDTLLSVFQTDDISNHLVYYLRFVTAGYLKKHREDYEPFLEFDCGMIQFCERYVEVMDQEADHIHVIALTKALKVPVEIAYMSGSNAMEQVNFHEFYPETEATKESGSFKPLVLLYRPGHYDILYRDE